MHLERADPEATWESDRAIRARWHGSGARVRLPGGRLHFPDGEAVGVELERYIKKLERCQGAVADADPADQAGVVVDPDRPGPAADQWLWEAGAGDVHQVYQLPEGVTSWPPSPSAGASYPSGLPAQPPDQRLDDAGNHRPQQVVLLLAGVVA